MTNAACDLSEKPELVLLIHGTGANDEADEGTAWWQRGSQFSQRLEARLAHANAQLCETPFHWSGDNLESERHFSGFKLLAEQLIELERREQPYHLIGHSHGGSVIWAALQAAVARGKRLEHLKSWTTVGTPFVHFKPRLALKAAFFAAMIWLAYYCIFIPPLMATLAFEGGSWLSRISGEIIQHQEGDPNFRWLIGQFGTFTNIYAIAGLLIFVLFISPFTAAYWWWSAWRVTRRKHKAMRAYGDRWFGIWSQGDEAINALAAAPRLGASRAPLLPRRGPSRQRDVHQLGLRLFLPITGRLVAPFFKFGRLGLFAARFVSYEWPKWLTSLLFRWTYNSLLAPRADRIVRDAIRKLSLGTDIPPRFALDAVTACPVPDWKVDSGLPPHTDEQLNATATAQCSLLADKLRRALGTNDVLTLADFNHVLTWRELVHTGYFDHQDVVELLALHIEMASGEMASGETTDADRANTEKASLDQAHLGTPPRSALQGFVLDFKQRVKDRLKSRRG